MAIAEGGADVGGFDIVSALDIGLLVTFAGGIGACTQNRTAPNTFDIAISDMNCRFDEYLYFNGIGNDATKLFHEEFLSAFLEHD